ncbi:MAG: serine/threonine-protein kinase, partial [Planctomycetota bacterium]
MNNGTTRFGELCVARDWLGAADVDAALAAQGELQRLGLPERIGEILRKRGLLTNEQVREILLQQGAGPLRDLVPGYEIQERLGQGGMGAVYRARRRSDGGAVALKLLPPRLGNNPEFVARFVREARAAAAMAHPNIVAGLDAGCADDHYFVAMELIEGESLDQWMQRAGALPEADVCAVGMAVCDALEYASAQGLVHRDIKPANILVQEGGGPLRERVKLCDLGLAKWVEDG